MNVLSIKTIANKKRPEEADVYAGLQLKVARKAAKMSQEKLGEQLDVTFQQIQKYEKGTNRMSASAIAQVSAILGVPPSFFFKPSEDEGRNDSQSAHPLNALAELVSNNDALELNMHFINVKSPKLRKQIIRLVQEIALAYEQV